MLARLTEASILWRLERRIGGVRAGSSSYVYGVAPFGYRILHHEGDARVRRHEPSATFLDHTLAVAQVVVDLQTRSRTTNLDVEEVQTEPACWRRFTLGLEGAQTLKPDLYLSLRSGDFEYQWFVEVDLATHSIASVVRKCWVYHRYWASGIEQDRSGLFPRMLLITPSERRANRIWQGIASTRGLNSELFAVTVAATALDHLVGCAT